MEYADLSVAKAYAQAARQLFEENMVQAFQRINEEENMSYNCSHRNLKPLYKPDGGAAGLLTKFVGVVCQACGQIWRREEQVVLVMEDD